LANFGKHEFFNQFITPKPARGGQASLGVAHKLKMSLRGAERGSNLFNIKQNFGKFSILWEFCYRNDCIIYI